MNPLYGSTARVALRTIKSSSSRATRPFSMAVSARSAAASLKAQLFEANAVTRDGAKPDWARVARHIGGASVFYFPWMIGFLSWPFLFKMAFNGNM